MKLVPTKTDNKVIIVGNPGVGKTSIISQLNSFTFSDKTPSTIAASYVAHTIDTGKGEVTLNIWDTAGQERYRSLIPMYSRSTSAAIIVTELTSQDSFESLDEWHRMLKSNCPQSCLIYVIANKKDLNHVVPVSHFSNWAETHQYPFFTTSALDRLSIIPVFMRIAQDLQAHQVAEEDKIATPKNREVHSECC